MARKVFTFTAFSVDDMVVAISLYENPCLLLHLLSF
jgi:hypothetical protein